MTSCIYEPLLTPGRVIEMGANQLITAHKCEQQSVRRQSEI